MEATYGVVVANKYSLFTDEDTDPLDIVRQNEELLKKKKDEGKPKSDKSAKTAKNKLVKKAVAPVETEQKTKQQDQNTTRREDNRSKGPNPSRPERSERGGRPFREPREPRENDGERRPERRRRDENSGSDFRDSGGFGGRPAGSSTGGGFGRPEGGFGSRPEGGFGSRQEDGTRSEITRGRGGFGGRRGRGGRRGQGEGRGGFDRREGGRREYERHSGSDKTGIKAVEKREGGGAHNWGSVKEDLDDQLKDANDSQEIAPPTEDTENQDPNESGELQENAVDAEPQEEEKQMTLDEWRQLQRQNRVKADFNIRKANEGVDDTQWKKMTKLAKKPKEEEESDEESDEDEDEHARQKALLPIRITFNDSPRRGRGGRRPRGGRGGRMMTGGGRGEGRRGPREAAPRFDDENDFPSLGVIKTVG